MLSSTDASPPPAIDRERSSSAPLRPRPVEAFFARDVSCAGVRGVSQSEEPRRGARKSSPCEEGAYGKTHGDRPRKTSLAATSSIFLLQSNKKKQTKVKFLKITVFVSPPCKNNVGKIGGPDTWTPRRFFPIASTGFKVTLSSVTILFS